MAFSTEGAAAGASSGSSFGPWGAAAGGVLGGFSGGGEGEGGVPLMPNVSSADGPYVTVGGLSVNKSPKWQELALVAVIAGALVWLVKD